MTLPQSPFVDMVRLTERAMPVGALASVRTNQVGQRVEARLIQIKAGLASL